MAKRVAVVGGINMDITGAPSGGAVLRDSNIGRVYSTPGGVGRNIAENLVRMGFEVQLVAPIGNDHYGDVLFESCKALNIGLDLAPRIDMPTGVYLCVTDGGGDMLIAVNAMDICCAVTPRDIDMSALNGMDGIVLDANLPEAVIHYVASNARVPVFADPVSVAKCNKLLSSLPYLYAIKPNLMEAEAMTGESEPKRAAEILCCAGVKNVFISLGTEGMYFKGDACSGMAGIVGRDMPIVNATGAGDSAIAAIAAGVLTGRDVASTATLACCVAALTVQSSGAVSERLTEDMLKR